LPWIVAIIISLALEVVAYLITPKPQQFIAQEVAPTADAGVPIPWVFGEMGIDATNVLWVGDLRTRTYSA
jgi:hypothetical protein